MGLPTDFPTPELVPPLVRSLRGSTRGRLSIGIAVRFEGRGHRRATGQCTRPRSRGSCVGSTSEGAEVVEEGLGQEPLGRGPGFGRETGAGPILAIRGLQAELVGLDANEEERGRAIEGLGLAGHGELGGLLGPEDGGLALAGLDAAANDLERGPNGRRPEPPSPR